MMQPRTFASCAVILVLEYSSIGTRTSPEGLLSTESSGWDDFLRASGANVPKGSPPYLGGKRGKSPVTGGVNTSSSHKGSEHRHQKFV